MLLQHRGTSHRQCFLTKLSHWLIVICVFGHQVDLSSTYRILGLFPHPGKSHYDITKPIMLGLAKAGHNVTVISHFPNTNAPIENFRDLPLTGLDILMNSIDLNLFSYRPSYVHFLEFFLLQKWGQQACENALNSSGMREILQMKERFDLIVIEQFNYDCMAGVAYKLQAPFVGISTSVLMPWHYSRFGNPHFPSFIPSLFMGYSEDMTYVQRLTNWFVIHAMNIMYRLLTQRQTNGILRRYFGEDIPDIDDIVQKTSLMLVNQHYSLSGPKPSSPSVIEIGGVHIRDPAPLDEELQNILNNSDNGVIYISWGSMIKSATLPDMKREAIIQAVSMFPQNVIWKWDNDTMINKPKNVYLRKWMPQREILCHPKVRVFMTHGGLLGSSEAAYCGVPVISTPIYGDQYINSAALAHRGMGVVLKYEDITKENVYEALKKALDPNTMENAKKVSYDFRNRPKPPLDTAIWWLEHVIATGGAPLTKSHSTVLPWYIYYSLDVYATFLCIIAIAILCWIWILRKYMFSKKESSEQNNIAMKVKRQ